MRWSRLASVALAGTVLAGCAVHPVVLEPERSAGVIGVRLGRPGLVVAAPHGTSDPRTAEIADAIARRTGFGLVVATGFALEPDGPTGPGRRYQVNRPLEGVPGRRAHEETATPEAQRVYEAWERRVEEAAQGPLAFYAEIHGNGRTEAAGRIEIATVGVDRDGAVRLRALFELIRDAHLRGHPGAPRLEVRVEPADPLVYTASGAKRWGILRRPSRALHIELPRAARHDWRAVYSAILADFLAQAVTLPAAR